MSDVSLRFIDKDLFSYNFHAQTVANQCGMCIISVVHISKISPEYAKVWGNPYQPLREENELKEGFNRFADFLFAPKTPILYEGEKFPGATPELRQHLKDTNVHNCAEAGRKWYEGIMFTEWHRRPAMRPTKSRVLFTYPTKATQSYNTREFARYLNAIEIPGTRNWNSGNEITIAAYDLKNRPEWAHLK